MNGNANYQAKYELERIYLIILQDWNNALRQFKKMTEILSVDHPYHRDALEVLGDLVGRTRAQSTSSR